MRQLNCDTGLGVTSPLIHPSVKNCHSEHEDQDKPDGQGSAFGFQGLVVQWLTKVKQKSRGCIAQNSPWGKFSTKVRVWSQARQESVNSRTGSYARVAGRKMLRGPRPLEGGRMTVGTVKWGPALPSGAKVLHWHVLLCSTPVFYFGNLHFGTVPAPPFHLQPWYFICVLCASRSLYSRSN